jgi:hypothetical protein
MTNLTTIPQSARIAVLEQEITIVRFLNRTGEGDDLRAAAGVRVLELQKEVSALRDEPEGVIA